MATGLIIGSVALASCTQKPAVDGAYDFIIYESDADNTVLSDNPIVATYHIEYVDCKTVPETLIKKGSAYFFSESSSDYLILKNSSFGLSYSEGYFENYSGCENGEQIDVSWSMVCTNGVLSNNGIGEESLQDLVEYGFIINGWK